MDFISSMFNLYAISSLTKSFASHTVNNSTSFKNFIKSIHSRFSDLLIRKIVGKIIASSNTSLAFSETIS